MRALPIALRVVTAVAGGYGLSAGLAALLAATLAATGALPRSEAVLASVVLAFAIYLVILLWAFAEPQLWRLIAIVAIGTPLTFWLARLLAAGLEAAG